MDSLCPLRVLIYGCVYLAFCNVVFAGDQWDYSIEVAPKTVSRADSDYTFSVRAARGAEWTFPWGGAHILPGTIRQSMEAYLRQNGFEIAPDQGDFELQFEVLMAKTDRSKLPSTVDLSNAPPHRDWPWQIWTLQLHLYRNWRLQGSWEAKGYVCDGIFISWKKTRRVYGKYLNIQFAEMYAELTRQLTDWVNKLPPKNEGKPGNTATKAPVQTAEASASQDRQVVVTARRTTAEPSAREPRKGTANQTPLPAGLAGCRLIRQGGDRSSFAAAGSYWEAQVHPGEVLYLMRQVDSKKSANVMSMIVVDNVEDGRVGSFIRTDDGAIFTLDCARDEEGEPVVQFRVFSGKKRQGERVAGWKGTGPLTLKLARDGADFRATVLDASGTETEVGSLSWPGLAKSQKNGIMLRGNSKSTPVKLLFDAVSITDE